MDGHRAEECSVGDGWCANLKGVRDVMEGRCDEAIHGSLMTGITLTRQFLRAVFAGDTFPPDRLDTTSL